MQRKQNGYKKIHAEVRRLGYAEKDTVSDFSGDQDGLRR
jgi:homoserine dehydrogenase